VGDVEHDEVYEELASLESSLNRSVERLMTTELRDTTQVGIIRELLHGERTISEIVMALYSAGPGNEGYMTYYTRIRRGLSDLESRGYVSRRLFGSKKPYRLTQLAIAKLTRIRGARTNFGMDLLPRKDLSLYTIAATMLVLLILSGRGLIGMPSPTTFLALVAVSFLLCGMALVRFVELLDKVI
jgi:hypothetical protein